MKQDAGLLLLGGFLLWAFTRREDAAGAGGAGGGGAGVDVVPGEVVQPPGSLTAGIPTASPVVYATIPAGVRQGFIRAPGVQPIPLGPLARTPTGATRDAIMGPVAHVGQPGALGSGFMLGETDLSSIAPAPRPAPRPPASAPAAASARAASSSPLGGWNTRPPAPAPSAPAAASAPRPAAPPAFAQIAQLVAQPVGARGATGSESLNPKREPSRVPNATSLERRRVIGGQML